MRLQLLRDLLWLFQQLHDHVHEQLPDGLVPTCAVPASALPAWRAPHLAAAVANTRAAKAAMTQ